MPELEDCPFCPNQGWYPDYDRNGEVVQVQCEFCWTNPLSKFNATNKACTGLAGTDAENVRIENEMAEWGNPSRHPASQ